MPIGASIWGPIAASVIGGAISNKRKSKTSPNYGPLQAQLLAMIKKRLGSSTDLSGYTSQGLQNTNRTFDLIGQSQANDLTARGLGQSPVAGAVDALRQNARGGAIAGFKNSIPLLQRQLQGDDLSLAARLFGGSESTGEEGGGLGGGLEGLAGMLGYFQSTGAFGGRGTKPLGSRQTTANWGMMPAGGTGMWG